MVVYLYNQGLTLWTIFSLERAVFCAGGEHRRQRDSARREARLEKAQLELQRLAAVRRKKSNPQRLASQAGRALQRLKAHKYFQYCVDEQGQLQFRKNEQLIRSEQSLDGLYLLHSSLEPARCAKEQVLVCCPLITSK